MLDVKGLMKHIPEGNPDSVQHFVHGIRPRSFFKDTKNAVQIFYTHVWKIQVLNSLFFLENSFEMFVQLNHLHADVFRSLPNSVL